jgi:hypothetical protein
MIEECNPRSALRARVGLFGEGGTGIARSDRP